MMKQLKICFTTLLLVSLTVLITACNTGETGPPEPTPTPAEQVEQDAGTAETLAQSQQFQEEEARNLAQLQGELAQLEVEAQQLLVC